MTSIFPALYVEERISRINMYLAHGLFFLSFLLEEQTVTEHFNGFHSLGYCTR